VIGKAAARLLEVVEQRPFDPIGTPHFPAYVELHKAQLVTYGHGGFVLSAKGREALALFRLETLETPEAPQR